MPGTAARAGQAGSYLICATPRTGSTLLCGLLASTGVAGRPESYFRAPDERSWATRWRIARPSGGDFSYAEFVRAAIAAGSSGNGVFGARMMWGTLAEVTGKLAAIQPELAGRDLDLLTSAFGVTRFVYLRRDNVVAQAVSWLRAEQTDVWFETGPGPGREPAREPEFDAARISALARLIGEHNAQWQRWFSSAGVLPHLVRYEDLDADPAGVTGGVLEFLGLERPAGPEIIAGHRRLADELSAQWIERYRNGGGGQPRLRPA